MIDVPRYKKLLTFDPLNKKQFASAIKRGAHFITRGALHKLKGAPLN
jgi:hypothetical protein